MARSRFVPVALLAAGLAMAAPGPAPGEAAGARERLADLLASERMERVEFSAASYDRAMALIYTAVDTYLAEAVPRLGGVETAEAYGVEVFEALDAHRIRYADEDGYDLTGERRIVVSTESEAEALGELAAEVASMLHDAHAGRGVAVQAAARRIFEGMLPVEGNGQPLVEQYLVRLRTLSGPDRRELLRWALE